MKILTFEKRRSNLTQDRYVYHSVYVNQQFGGHLEWRPF